MLNGHKEKHRHMKINEKTLLSTEERILLVVEYEEQTYQFEAKVYETPSRKFVTEISYLDKYCKPLKITVERKIKKYLRDKLMEL